MRITEQDLSGDEDLLSYISVSDEDSDVEKRLEKDENLRRKVEELYPLVPPPSDSFSNIIIVAGLPCPTDEDKIQKLTAILIKKISSILEDEQLGTSSSHFAIDTLTVDRDGSKIGAGVAMLTLSPDVDARAVVEVLNEEALDKKHDFKVCRYDDLDSILKQKYEPKPVQTIMVKRDQLRNWLTDPMGREQFAFRCSLSTELMWFDGLCKQAVPVCDHDKNLGRWFTWSPMGSYLLTIHKRGAWIRAYDTFEKIICFSHRQPLNVTFSPDEELLITCNCSLAQRISRTLSIIVWKTNTGQKLTVLPLPAASPNNAPMNSPDAWPYYLFSSDSRYLAGRDQKSLLIYDTTTMKLIEDPTNPMLPKKLSWMTCQLEQFQWSPSNNLMSIWIAEKQETPGRLLIVDVSKREEIASKNFFSVDSVSMHWSECGNFFAFNTVIKRKILKKVKKAISQIEVFRVKQKSVPVDIVDMEGHSIKGLFWEKSHNMNRFAALTSEESPPSQKIHFFEVLQKGIKQDTKLVQTLPVGNNVNTFVWSPAGQYFVAATKGTDGSLIFGNINDQNKVEVIQKDEHPDVTDILWDPSGRYVTTAVLMTPGMQGFRFSMNSEFRIYSFLGRLLYRYEDQTLAQFAWRPRPPLIASKEEVDEVIKKLKEYSKRFDIIDEERRQERLNALREEGSEILEKFNQFVDRAKSYINNHPLRKEWEEGWNQLNKKLDWKEEVVETVEIIDVIREKFKAN